MKKIIFCFCFIPCACSSGNELPSIDLADITKIDMEYTVPLDSVVARTEIIPLGNHQAPLIGEITDLCESDDYYYVVSDGNAIYQYDKKGTFIRPIGAQGRGPAEYLYVQRITSDSDHRLNVFDLSNQTLLKYDSTGNLVLSFRPSQDTSFFISSFFPYKSSLIFTTSNNSVKMDLLAYSNKDGSLTGISRRDRVMMPDEFIISRTFSFGSHADPFVCHYFNDTVYHIRDNHLAPALILKAGSKPSFQDLLDVTKLSKSYRTYFKNIVQAGGYLFITYNNTWLDTKPKSQLLFAVYDIKTHQYAPHVTLTEPERPYLSISSESRLFHGMETNTLIMAQTPGGILKAAPAYNIKADDNPVLIKYWIK